MEKARERKDHKLAYLSGQASNVFVLDKEKILNRIGSKGKQGTKNLENLDRT